MKKIEFACSKCGKKILVQVDIYNKVYKNQGTCLFCRQAGIIGRSVHREDKI